MQNHPLSSNKETNCDVQLISGLRCQLELGCWTINSINALLRESWRKSQDPNERISLIAQSFLGTPYLFESQLEIPPDGQIRVRLQTFDCTTFIYTVIALSSSVDFDEFVRNLYAIRYRGSDFGLINNQPETGNIFDFVHESLVQNAVERGFLVDVTKSIVESAGLEPLTFDVRPVRRKKPFDKRMALATPKFRTGLLTLNFLKKGYFPFMQAESIRSGDIILMTKGKVGLLSNVIDHLAVAAVENGEVFFIHSTRHFAWIADKQTDQKFHTGVFYGDDFKREQLGVDWGRISAGDHSKFIIDNLSYYGYDSRFKRTLKDYIARNFYGFIILRPAYHKIEASTIIENLSAPLPNKMT